jgi:hypothetical protein
MRVFRTTVALLLVLALAATASAAHKDKKARKAAKPFRGVVVAVERDQNDNGGTITVRRHNGKRAVEKKFTVRDVTKFERGKGKRAAKRQLASSRGLKEGQKVVIRARGDEVQDIKVLRHGKVARNFNKEANAKNTKHAKAAKKQRHRAA